MTPNKAWSNTIRVKQNIDLQFSGHSDYLGTHTISAPEMFNNTAVCYSLIVEQLQMVSIPTLPDERLNTQRADTDQWPIVTR